MGLPGIEQLVGGSRRRELDDFVRRYDDGPPHEGYSDDEVIDRYEQVSEHVPDDVYEESAYEAFARMSPRERREFLQWTRQQARAQDVHVPDFDQDGIDDRVERDPRALARLARSMHSRDPGLFGEVVSGGHARRRGRRQQPRKKQGGGSPLGHPLAKGALAGIAAIAAKKMLT